MLTIKLISINGIIGVLTAISIIPFSSERCKAHVDKGPTSIMIFSQIQAARESDGKILNFIDSFYIYNSGQYTMYQVPEIVEYSNISRDSSGNISKIEFLRSEIIFNYWVFQNGDSIGIRFDSLSSKTGNTFSVDSLTDAKTSFKEGIELDTYHLWEKISDSATHFFTEKYVPKIKEQTSPDSSFLYFRNDWNDINFSLVPDLDLQKKSKLYKFRAIFNPVPKGQFAFELPRREIIVEIRQPIIRNPHQIIGLFETFRNAKN